MAGRPSPSVLQAARTLWDYHLIYDPLSEADLIIGLGSYDLRVADHCVHLLQEGIAPGFSSPENRGTGPETSTTAARQRHLRRAPSNAALRKRRFWSSRALPISARTSASPGPW